MLLIGLGASAARPTLEEVRLRRYAITSTKVVNALDSVVSELKKLYRIKPDSVVFTLTERNDSIVFQAMKVPAIMDKSMAQGYAEIASFPVILGNLPNVQLREQRSHRQFLMLWGELLRIGRRPCEWIFKEKGDSLQLLSERFVDSLSQWLPELSPKDERIIEAIRNAMEQAPQFTDRDFWLGVYFIDGDMTPDTLILSLNDGKSSISGAKGYMDVDGHRHFVFRSNWRGHFNLTGADEEQDYIEPSHMGCGGPRRWKYVLHADSIVKIFNPWDDIYPKEYRRPDNRRKKTAASPGLYVAGGVLLALIAAAWLFWRRKNKRQ